MKSRGFMSLTIFALMATNIINHTSAIQLRIDPDIFGPEGENYMNNNTNIDISTIGIDILNDGENQNEKKCENG